jgi:hypothetical protein
VTAAAYRLSVLLAMRRALRTGQDRAALLLDDLLQEHDNRPTTMQPDLPARSL